jgi:teichuronic acid biosynthesis glycosyltransferase TuaG
MSVLVSIITPSYNSARFINECVSSVLEQTYTNWELIIVDDASSDNSRELIKNIAAGDKRIKFAFLTENIGAAGARNIALEMSEGRYIAFLDSDDQSKLILCNPMTSRFHFPLMSQCLKTEWKFLKKLRPL